MVIGPAVLLVVSLAGAPDPVAIVGRQVAAGRFHLARHLYDRLVTGGSPSARLLVLRAQILAKVGTSQEAAAALSAGLWAAPADPALLALKERDRPRAASPGPSPTPAPSPPPRVEECVELKTKGRFEEAAACFEKVLEANPDDFRVFSHLVDAVYRRAEELGRAGQRQKAHEVFDRAKRIEEVHAPQFKNEFQGTLEPPGLATQLGR